MGEGHAGTRKRIRDIEDVLQWAYRHELPKRKAECAGGEPCQVSPMFRMAQYGVRVDNWSREPGFPAALGEPHPDALRIEAAVNALSRFADQSADDELQLAPDFRGLVEEVDERKAVAHALGMMTNLVATHAKAANRPFWSSRPDISAIKQPNGQPIVLRWETQLRKTASGGTAPHEFLVPVAYSRSVSYPEGSYCPLEFFPEPQSIVVDRAEYLVWWGALHALAAELVDLQDFTVLPPSAAQKPWLGERELGKPARILEDRSTYYREVRETAAAHRMLGLRRVGAPRRGETPVPLARRFKVSEVA